MTVYYIEVAHTVHTCPGDPDTAHIIDTRQTIIGIVEGGPCQTPVTIRFNGREYQRPCHYRNLTDQQCSACRRIVWTVSTTVTDLGYQHPPTHPVDGTLAADVCRVCHTPVAGFLGVHLLCRPSTTRVAA